MLSKNVLNSEVNSGILRKIMGNRDFLVKNPGNHEKTEEFTMNLRDYPTISDPFPQPS